MHLSRYVTTCRVNRCFWAAQTDRPFFLPRAQWYTVWLTIAPNAMPPHPAMPAPFWLKLRLSALALLRWLLHRWVRTTVVPEDLDALGIGRSGHVFYMLDTQALTSLLITDQLCINQHWPRPVRPLQAGAIQLPRSHGFDRRYSGLFFRSLLRRRHSAMLSELLTQCMEHPEQTVQIVPVTVLIGRAPGRNSGLFKILFSESWDVGGRLRRLFTTLVNGRSTLVQLGQPFSLNQIIDSTQDREQALARASRLLRVHFKRVRTSAIGPDRSHRRVLTETLLQSPSVRAAIEAKARRDGIGIEKAEAIAQGYMREIAANYSYSFVRVADLILTWFFKRIYRGVEVRHFDKFRSASTGHEVVYVPCHRSHIDYLLLSYLLYHRGFVPPHIAAGINLNMPVVGPLLRLGGAFFLRRSFRAQPLYAAVFNQYVAMLVSRGVAMEYFIEGTRSRTGRLMPARAGMLSITVRAFLSHRDRPVLFQPVYIGYERLAEGTTYIAELSGQQKKPESLADFRNLFNILRKNYGEVAVSFGEPIALNDVLDAHHQGWRDEPFDENNRPNWLNPAVDDLADRILVNINGASHVNAVNLLALALLASQRHALDEEGLIRLLERLKGLIARSHYTDHITVTKQSGTEIIEYGVMLGIIARQSHALGPVITCRADAAVLLTYFRNNVAHLLAITSWIACCFVNLRRLRRDRLLELTRVVYPFLQRELFLPWPDSALAPVVERCVEALLEQGLLTADGDHVLRATALSEAHDLRLLANTMLQTFERYFITIAVLVKNGSGRITRQQLEQLCSQIAQRISILHEFDAPEFYDRTLFKQFIDVLGERGTLRRDDQGRLEFGAALEGLADDAKLVLDKEIRYTILRSTPDITQEDSAAAQS